MKMKNQILKQAILVLLTMLIFISVSIAGITKLPPGSETSTTQKMKFDGIWAGPANVTLIKELNGYIILQGKDQASTWLARGVINGNQIICRGSGVTNGGHQFIYESSLTLKGAILQDSWKAIFSEGKELKGNDVLEKVEVEKHKKLSR
jgi:hypothetical protein